MPSPDLPPFRRGHNYIAGPGTAVEPYYINTPRRDDEEVNSEMLFIALAIERGYTVRPRTMPLPALGEPTRYLDAILSGSLEGVLAGVFFYKDNSGWLVNSAWMVKHRRALTTQLTKKKLANLRGPAEGLMEG